MKPVWIMILILIFMIGGGIFLYNYIENSSLELIKQVVKIEDFIFNNNFDEASNNLEEFNQKLDRIEKVWNIILDHNLLYNIQLSSARLKGFLDNNETVDSLVETSSLKKMIEHIVEEESFSLVNIL